MSIMSPTISPDFLRGIAASRDYLTSAVPAPTNRAAGDRIHVSRHPMDLAKTIDAAFDAAREIGPATKGEVREAVEQALDLLDRGTARVAEADADGCWQVNQWLKKAVLLSFRLNDMSEFPAAPATPRGGTRCRRNSIIGATRIFAPLVSARCRAAWCAAPPISRPAWC